jgi:hypothetical protein
MKTCAQIARADQGKQKSQGETQHNAADDPVDAEVNHHRLPL